MFDGQFEAALKEIELAKRLSPRDMAMSTFLMYEASIHLGLGDLETAAVRAREATSLSPLNYDARVLYILTLDAMGRNKEARAVLDTLLTHTPEFSIDSLWNTPVPDVFLGDDAASLKAEERPNFHAFVKERLEHLGWQN